MAIDLGEYVVEGGLHSDGKYHTQGWVELREVGRSERDWPMVLRFSVTGDPDPDLMGKRIWFAPAEDDRTQKVMSRAAFEAVNPTQHGVTGTMTAQGWVRALPCPREEFERRAALGEAPPTAWRRRLYIEWFGPSGLITIELAGAEVAVCTREPNWKDKSDDGEWEPLPNNVAPPWLDGPRETTTPTSFRRESQEFAVEQRRPFEASPKEQEYLESFLERQQEECSISDDDSEASVRRNLEDLQRMEYCHEHQVRVPLTALVGDLSALPDPDTLNDSEVERLLKSILARMVTHGVVLDVCKHYRPRDCYRLLRDEILPNQGFHEELVGTDWITHFSTYDHCAKCDEEMDREIEEWEREREKRERGELEEE